MDWERHKVTAETGAIRARGWLNLIIRAAGLSLLIVGAINMIVLHTNPIFPIYRKIFYSLTGGAGIGTWVIADFLAMAIGASVAHFL